MGVLTKDCPHCGAENGELALECSACGIVFKKYGRHSLKRPGRRTAGIGVLLAGLAAVLIVVVVSSRDPQGDPVEDEVVAVDTQVVDAEADSAPRDEAPPAIAGLQLILVPLSDGVPRVRVDLAAIDNKVQPAEFAGDVTLSWGLQTPDQHNEVLQTGAWVEGRTTLHEIPVDPVAMKGSTLVVEARAQGLTTEARLIL